MNGAGFSVGRETLSFAVEGMTCAACATRVERALGRIPGVLEASVNLVAERASINIIRRQVRTEDVATALQRAGYSADFDPAGPEAQVQLDETRPTMSGASSSFPRRLPFRLSSACCSRCSVTRTCM